MYKKILYPIKFEEFSLDVLSCILNFKKASGKLNKPSDTMSE